MGGLAMSEPFTVLQTQEADRRLLMKLQYRLLRTPMPQNPALPEGESVVSLAFALAPMTLAFIYLIVLSFFLFR